MHKKKIFAIIYSSDMLEELLKWQIVGDWAFAFNDIVYNDGSDIPTQRKIYWRNGDSKIKSESIFSKKGRKMLWFYLSLVVPNPPPLIITSAL